MPQNRSGFASLLGSACGKSRSEPSARYAPLSDEQAANRGRALCVLSVLIGSIDQLCRWSLVLVFRTAAKLIEREGEEPSITPRFRIDPSGT